MFEFAIDAIKQLSDERIRIERDWTNSDYKMSLLGESSDLRVPHMATRVPKTQGRHL